MQNRYLDTILTYSGLMLTLSLPPPPPNLTIVIIPISLRTSEYRLVTFNLSSRPYALNLRVLLRAFLFPEVGYFPTFINTTRWSSSCYFRNSNRPLNQDLHRFRDLL